MTRPAFARTTLLVLVVLAAALGIPLGHLSPVSPARAATLPLTGNIAGPTAVGVAIQTTYTVSATGGPAEAPNGTQVGIYSYKASYSAVNTTGAAFTPTSGVLVNGTSTLSFTAPNVTEPLTLFVLVKSAFNRRTSPRTSPTPSRSSSRTVSRLTSWSGLPGRAPVRHHRDARRPARWDHQGAGLAAGESYPITFAVRADPDRSPAGTPSDQPRLRSTAS